MGTPRGGGQAHRRSSALRRALFSDRQTNCESDGLRSDQLRFRTSPRSMDRRQGDRPGNRRPLGDIDVEYLPLRSNKFAEGFPNYDPRIAGHAPDDRYHTKSDGSFRVLTIPGVGVLGGSRNSKSETITRSSIRIRSRSTLLANEETWRHIILGRSQVIVAVEKSSWQNRIKTRRMTYS